MRMDFGYHRREFFHQLNYAVHYLLGIGFNKRRVGREKQFHLYIQREFWNNIFQLFLRYIKNCAYVNFFNLGFYFGNYSILMLYYFLNLRFNCMAMENIAVS